MKTRTNKIKHNIVIVMFGVMLTSCFDRGISSEDELLEEKISVIYNNDGNSYVELENYYSDNEKTYFELLPTSLKMMKEQNMGHSDFFYTYMKISFKNKYDPENISKLSTKEREFLIEILNKGSEVGDSRCDSILSVLPK